MGKALLRMGSSSEKGREKAGILLGKVALGRGLITPEQLREVLEEQARDLQAGRPAPRMIGNILVTKGYITDRQLEVLLEEQKVKTGAPPAPRPAVPIPASIGKYKVLREVGRGAMGVVLETIDTGLNRKVALKMLLSNPGADPEETAREEERFLKEARLCASVAKHPHIVSIYETGTIEGRRYIAMEYVEGRQLSEWRKAGPPSLRQQVRLLRDVALAIHHAHQEGLIHRDLKPANVLVDSRNAPHITDFGLAKSVGHDAPLSAVAAGRVAGTPLYMSPEQAKGSPHAGRSTDIYPLGVMLYEALTGRTPFRGESRQEIILKLLEDPVPSPSSVCRPVGHPPPDPALEKICLKALEKNPRDRYPTAQALADDLSKWIKGEEASTAPPKSDRRRIALAAGAAGAIVLIVLGFILSRPSGTSEADRLVRTARKMMETGACREAWDLYLKAVRENPSDPEVLAGKKAAEKSYLDFLESQSGRLADQGRFDEAEEVFEPVLAKVPDHPRAVSGKDNVRRRKLEARVTDAGRLLEEGNFTGALLALGVVLDEQPSHPKALELKAKAKKGLSSPTSPAPAANPQDGDGWTPILGGRDAAGWKAISGKARVDEDALVLPDGAEVMQRVTSADFEIKGRLKISGTKPVGCIAFRRPGPTRGSPSRLLFHYDGDIHLVDAETRAKSGAGSFRPGDWNSFLLSVRGGDVSVAIQGRIVLKGPASSLDPGNLALYSSTGGMSIAFMDLRLREIR